MQGSGQNNNKFYKIQALRKGVRAMRRGSDMRVEATSNRGTATAYTFSLLGVTAALEQVDDLCG